MKTRILVVTSVLAMLGCDRIERDYSKCNAVHSHCKDGYTCVSNRCVPIEAHPDAAIPIDAPPAVDLGTASRTAFEAGPALRETAATRDTTDAPWSQNGLSLDGPGDPGMFDSSTGNVPRTCHEDQDCPASQPLCLNSVCVQCRNDDDCPLRGDDSADDDGTSRGALCDLKTNQCVECLSHEDCRDPDRPLCGADQTCVGCASATAPEDGCATRNPATPACNAAIGNCVECTSPRDCAPKARDGGTGDDPGDDSGLPSRVCSPKNTCVECNNNADCTADPARAFCRDNVCVGCRAAGDGACTGTKSLCATSGARMDQCVECVTNAHCLRADSPICDPRQYQCRGCRKDSECSAQAGVCGVDGSCPGTNAVLYVQATTGCSSSNPGSGTPNKPYCDLSYAISSITSSRSIIRVVGDVRPAKDLIVGHRAFPILIAGVSTSSTTPTTIKPPVGSTTPVISITDGDVTLRDLIILDGRGAGISASSGTLHVNRCYVLNNAGTGIAVAVAGAWRQFVEEHVRGPSWFGRASRRGQQRDGAHVACEVLFGPVGRDVVASA